MYRKQRFMPVLLAFSLLLPVLLWYPAEAIVIRHDKGDSRYVANAADYPQIFYLHYRFENRVCLATLISSDWALTAAHCTDQTPLGEELAQHRTVQVEINGRPHHLDKAVIHPDYIPYDQPNGVDLALLRLQEPVLEVEPARLYGLSDELGQVVWLGGWGYTGIGTRGASTNDGKFRVAENRVEETDKWLVIRFDDPRDFPSRALPLEGVPGLGDSGGPAFQVRDGVMTVLGVALGELEEGEENAEFQGLYGAREVYERTSAHLQWIEDVTGLDFSPAGP